MLHCFIHPCTEFYCSQNDHVSVIPILRLIELKRRALNEDVLLNVKLEEYNLVIDLHITSTLMDMKWRNYVMALGTICTLTFGRHVLICFVLSGLNTFPCFLCDVSTANMYKEENIRAGFKMNRKYAELKEAAEALRYIEIFD